MKRLILLLFFILHIIHCSCPDGFELMIAGECRMLKPISMNIRADQATNTAISQCKALQDQPIIIHNDEQQLYWTEKRVQTNKRIILGLVCNTSTFKWQWADGSAVDYKPHSAGYDSGLDKNCKSGCVWMVYITIMDIGMNMIQCNKSYADCDQLSGCDTGVADFDIYCTVQLQQPIPNGDGCESFEDDSDDGLCYQIGAKAASWKDAQMACQNLGANLASIHNEKENSFLRRLAVSRGVVDGIFLGATSSGKGNNYGWIDGTEWDYQNFYPGFPINGLGECVAMDTQSTSGEWVNTDCSSNFSVACVRLPMGPPTCKAESWKEGRLIVSPGFPYDASVPCDFMLIVAAGKKIEMEILTLEANKCCDNVIIYENSIGNTVIANVTGSIEHQKYKTVSSNIMRVSWKPNGGVNVQGLAFTFNAI